MPSNEDEEFHVYHTFLPGWAKRPPHGQCYGKKYIGDFLEDILELFMAGEADKRMKMGAGRMREFLTKRYPERLDIPADPEIRSAISKFIVQRQKGVVPSVGSGTRGRKAILLPTNVLFHLTVLYRNNNSLTWKPFLMQLKTTFDDAGIEWEDGFTEDQIHNRHSAFRKLFKNSNILPDIPEHT
jgi:hypothetical protein